jgi:hypothetical protein
MFGKLFGNSPLFQTMKKKHFFKKELPKKFQMWPPPLILIKTTKHFLENFPHLLKGIT